MERKRQGVEGYDNNTIFRLRAEVPMVIFWTRYSGCSKERIVYMHRQVRKLKYLFSVVPELKKNEH